MSDQSIESAVAAAIADDAQSRTIAAGWPGAPDESASECNGVSFPQLFDATNNFAFAFTAWTGEEGQQAMGTKLAQSLSDADRADLIFSLLTSQSRTHKELGPEDKIFAVRLAQTLGPDYAQWLYHFAVFCTKAV
jgi:hypothetical protein